MNNKAPTAPSAAPGFPLLRILWSTPWPIAVLLFVATFFLTTRHNDFPYYYNFDEPTKTAQVLSGKRNFFHPPLLLNTTALATRVFGTPREDQPVVVAGRTVSAAFTAVAVAALAVLAFYMAGPVAALCGGALVMTHSMVFELSHFMKEDPALLAGLCLTFLAVKIFWDAASIGGRREQLALVFLGAASGLALSGKYVGIAGLIIAVIGLTLAPAGTTSRWKRFGIFAAVFIGTLLVINGQLLTQLTAFQTGLDANVGDLSRERKWTDVPHFRRVGGLYRELVSWPVGLFFAFQLGWQWVRDRRNGPAWMVMLYPLIYTAILTFSPRLFSRHFLPIFVMIHFVAALGIANFAALVVAVGSRFLNRSESAQPWRFAGAVSALTALGLLTLIVNEFHRPRLEKFYDCFANPTRETLVAWMNAELPETAVLAQDKEVYLTDLADIRRGDVRQRIVTVKQLSDFETVARLREAGVTHVIAHERWSGQFLKTEKRKKPGQGKASKAPEPIRNFYEELRAQSDLVWKVGGGSSGYLAPGLQVYALRPR